MSQAALSYNTPFNFEHHNVRVIVENDEPWFVGKDVCVALGIKNHTDAIRRLNHDEKKGGVITDPLGKNAQRATGINEPGVYRLVFTSRVESAERFKRWLAHEVLPVIRKTGSYAADKPIEVREHKRRTSTKLDDALNLKRNIDRLEAVADKIQPAAPNMCAMVIDGQPVFIDVNKYDGAGRAVVLEHDGTMKLQYVEQEQVGFKPFGERSALGERKKTPYGTTVRNTVAVVGMVIEAHVPQPPMPTQPVQPMQIEHVPVKVIEKPTPKDPYRDKILALLGTGLSKRQIAEKVGCSIHGVDYWHRKLMLG